MSGTTSPNKNTYNINAIIGQGTTGIVYKVTKKGSNEEYAMKSISYPLSNQRKINAIRNEIKIMTILSEKPHPNIVTLYESWEHIETTDITFYLVMELLGDDIFTYHRDKNPSYITCFMKQLLSAVEYMHSHRIIHRDLKLQNITVTLKDQLKEQSKDKTIKTNEPFQIKIIDFGLALLLPEGKTTILAEAAGTPSTIAPEIYFQVTTSTNISKYTYLVDEWACGIILFIISHKKSPYLHLKQTSSISDITNFLVDYKRFYNQTKSIQAKGIKLSLLFPTIKEKEEENFSEEQRRDDKIIYQLLNPNEKERPSARSVLENNAGYFSSCSDERFQNIPIEQFISIFQNEQVIYNLNHYADQFNDSIHFNKLGSLSSNTFVYMNKGECFLFQKVSTINKEYEYGSLCGHKMDLLIFFDFYKKNKNNTINFCYHCSTQK